MRFFLVLAACLALAAPARGQDAAPLDDNARVLAGLPVPDGSPLAAIEAQPAWKRHAAAFNASFERVETSQLSPIRQWSKANLKVLRPTLFYMFSGPDFLYADSFFPDVKTYVMAGLEPPGAIPNLSKLPKGAVPGVLRSLEVSLSSILGHSFFKTADMRSDLRASAAAGTIPILYVFLARTGHTIDETSLVQLDDNGEAEVAAEPKAGRAQGVKIVFHAKDGASRTLYYFSANIAGIGFKTSGLELFCDKLGEGVAFIKSASYLLHGGGFTQVRDFLLKHSAEIVQDDTGVPVVQFGSGWQLEPYGRYAGPIAMFSGFYQPRMAVLFGRAPRKPLDFGLGYRYRPGETSLIVAVKAGEPKQAATAAGADSKANDKKADDKRPPDMSKPGAAR